MKKVSKAKLSGIVRVPPSKSDAQRAILCAALSVERSLILNHGTSKDVRSMMEAVKTLGAELITEKDQLTIKGFALEAKNLTVNVGESGLSLRILIPVCAALSGRYLFTGESSILRRKHEFFERYLSSPDLEIRSKQGRLPIQLSGKLKSGPYQVDGSESSQYISGLLMALPLLDYDSELHIHHLKSRPYVKMTLRTLNSFGIQVEEIGKDVYHIKGRQKFRAATYQVEGDWSSASYWLAAAALGHQVRLSGLDMSSLQADRSMLMALESAGCTWGIKPDGALYVDGSHLKAFNFDATDCPDLFPALTALAVCCEGNSNIKGLSRLSNKESNRGLVLQEEFLKLGAEIELHNDEMIITGGKQLKSAVVNAHSDHRMAMCLAIAATMIEGGLEIKEADVVEKSYPTFWNDLKTLIH